MTPEKDRAMATGDLHKTFWSSGSRDTVADRHTDRQMHRHTDKLSTILCSPTRAE